ncbi:efflux RND transporter periplasmic adaptor subunit [Desulforhopalus singaporensis]|uniref:RND family efflux transporter, MFP subunit n=1 Tax=Desulforhopalus singaporensis TaxID=91360 RepID=A0A1H0JZU1_9BACT|nr:HlyD family efflux transporter periplasmic adaptor subunit [Desulforhopalus singaporensis]SDO49197.1 RND family efflux transporter, MFP subunit [Desulforhopalus singaporensis]
MKRIMVRPPLILSALLLLVAALGLVYLFLWERDGDGVGGVQHVVKRRSFPLQIVERGVIGPARTTPVTSRIQGNLAKIVWLIKEGSTVSKKDLVARFDPKPFVDIQIKAEQDYRDAEATYLAAQKLLTLQQEEEAGKIEEAVRKVEIAEIEAMNIRKGSGPLKRKMLEQKLGQALRQQQICSKELDDMSALLKKGHVSVSERDKAKDKDATAREQVVVAQTELDNFDTYAWPQMVREAELMVSGAKSNLERTRRTAELHIGNKMAEVEKYRRKMNSSRTALDRAVEDVENCSISAPAAGIILYAEVARETGRRKIQLGDTVWFGQTFLTIPGTFELVADVQVREVDVTRLTTDMPAEIEIDAFPDRIFPGKVARIASLAKVDDDNAHIRRFPARISLEGDSSGVHVGMSATIKIVYDRVEDRVAVPISSIVYRDDKTFVKRLSETVADEVAVQLGRRGGMLVEIVSGLEPGDIILAEGF